jgi:hypothetical protein
VLTLQIGQDKWSYDASLNTSYHHEDGGRTIFIVYRDGVKIYEYVYPSWWLHPDTFFNVIEGAPPDEEKDFLAYVHSMFEFERSGTKSDLVWHSI